MPKPLKYSLTSFHRYRDGESGQPDGNSDSVHYLLSHLLDNGFRLYDKCIKRKGKPVHNWPKEKSTNKNFFQDCGYPGTKERTELWLSSTQAFGSTVLVFFIY